MVCISTPPDHPSDTVQKKHQHPNEQHCSQQHKPSTTGEGLQEGAEVTDAFFLLLEDAVAFCEVGRGVVDDGGTAGGETEGESCQVDCVAGEVSHDASPCAIGE